VRCQSSLGAAPPISILTVLSEVVDEYEEKAEAEEAANLAELERVTADLKRRKNQ